MAYADERIRRYIKRMSRVGWKKDPEEMVKSARTAFIKEGGLFEESENQYAWIFDWPGGLDFDVHVGLVSGAGALKATVLATVLDNQATNLANKELSDLGNFLQNSLEDVKYIPGPIKGIDRLLVKTMIDYNFDYSSNKDVVRCTLACKDDAAMGLAAALIESTCVTELDMFICEKKIKNPDKFMGYSDTTFIVGFFNCKLAVEVQVNNIALLYAKMKPESFMNQNNYSQQRYNNLKSKIGLPGGLGHLFYEIYRENKNNPKLKDIDNISKEYYNTCKNQGSLNPVKLNEFKKANEDLFRGHEEAWNKLVE